MKLFTSIINYLRRRGIKAPDNLQRSKFERFDFSPERFECGMSALSNTGACSDLFLNRYTTEDINSILKRAGLIRHLGEKGFAQPLIKIDKDTEDIHKLLIYNNALDPELVVEIRISQIIYTPEERHLVETARERRFNVIAVEWLALQDPSATFSGERPRLPGQTHPGLGAVRYVLTILEMLARGISSAAVLDVPEEFHAAVMYSRMFRFTDPEQEGMMRAVLRDLSVHSLADISWGFHTGTIINARSGKPAAYLPSEQLLPVNDFLKRYFDSRQYHAAVEEAANKSSYRLDYDRMVRLRER